LKKLAQVLRAEILQVVPRPDFDRHRLGGGLAADIAHQSDRFQRKSSPRVWRES
jgi:hypothetical protein